MRIILRDDDTSYFTTPAMLERVYAPLWERGIPVCLAVIPAHHGNIVLPFGDQPFIDPNIHPDYRRQDHRFPITENAELCGFLNRMAREGLIEICLHGYDHHWPEWQVDERAIAEARLRAGRDIFDAAFPGLAIRTFITPYDAISGPALDAILGMGYHTALSPRSVPESYGAMPDKAHIVRTMPGGAKLFVGGFNVPEPDPAAWLAGYADTDSTLFLVNHYYMFYRDFGPVDDAVMTPWERFVSALLDGDYAECITTFADA
jgi:hypothetical protein